MNNIYHFKANGGSIQESIIRPKKVLILIDDAQSEIGSILEWLTGCFLKYCYEKTFKDFISYDIQSFKTDLKISDFFDFRFVISNRISPTIDNFPGNLSGYESLLKEIVLEPLSKQNMEILLMEIRHR